MLIVISPAKTLKTDIAPIENSTFPEFLEQSAILAKKLKKFTVEELSLLLKVSPKIAHLNYERYNQWRIPYKKEEGSNALLTFRGEVYNGIDADSYSIEELDYAQRHLRILSGLYGILRPLDVILPYRLEMSTKLKTKDFKNLYDFWDNIITESLSNVLIKTGNDILINLASEEYFKSINKKKLNARVITPVFKDEKNGTFKVISIYAKKARGKMTSYILKNKLSDPEKLKLFDDEGYYFNENLSVKDTLVFTR
jgi:cytoplasmic iron level regulating protein YaaA (DUF328/UPF0246 family)